METLVKDPSAGLGQPSPGGSGTLGEGRELYAQQFSKEASNVSFNRLYNRATYHGRLAPADAGPSSPRPAGRDGARAGYGPGMAVLQVLSTEKSGRYRCKPV
jgi:hypothetical protein